MLAGVLMVASFLRAPTRFLSLVEARIYNFAYHRNKLAIVPGVEHASFTNLSAAEQARINIEGYRAYLQWADARPRLLYDPERPESTDVDLLSNQRGREAHCAGDGRAIVMICGGRIGIDAGVFLQEHAAGKRLGSLTVPGCHLNNSKRSLVRGA